MEISNLFTLIGGVALFLFGMSVMGSSLKKVAGSKMEMILYKMSGNTLKGVLLGTGVTAVIQSSSATSVMVVGFVNSGMMKVKQAIGVILGAILGTSITGWILCLNSLGGTGASIAGYFNTEILTGIVALFGIIFYMFCKKAVYKNVGGIMLGFAVLMYGMSMMSGAIAPLREDPLFINMLTKFTNPFLGVLAGMIVTAVIQSASASVGILQALAVTGAIHFDVAFPIIMGIGIGASVPVMLSALGADTNGKRTAFVYLIIDVLGAVICGTIFYVLNAIFHFEFMDMQMTMITIALTNTLYRLVTVILLSPCIGVLERIVCVMFPESKEAAAEQADMDRLETRFLTHPALALTQSKTVIDSMAAQALDSIECAVSVRQEYDKKTVKRVYELENVVDRYEDKLGNYLLKISQSHLNKEQSKEVSKYLRVLSDFERMSDHARNIGRATDEIEEKKVSFSQPAEQELAILESAISELSGITINAFVEGDTKEAVKIDPLVDVVNDLCDEIKSNHIERVGRGECTLQNGFILNDLLTDYERIADHCSNVAVDLLESEQDTFGFASHEYRKNEDYKQNDTYDKLFNDYKQQYVL